MFKKLKKDEEGSAIVELAIVLPLFLVLVFGYIFYMNAVSQEMIIQTIAREGARTYANPIYGVDMNSYTKSVINNELNNNDIKDAKVEVFSNGYDRIVIIEKPYSTRFPLNKYTLRGYAVFHTEPYDT